MFYRPSSPSRISIHKNSFLSESFGCSSICSRCDQYFDSQTTNNFAKSCDSSNFILELKSPSFYCSSKNPLVGSSFHFEMMKLFAGLIVLGICWICHLQLHLISNGHFYSPTFTHEVFVTSLIVCASLIFELLAFHALSFSTHFMKLFALVSYLQKSFYPLFDAL